MRTVEERCAEVNEALGRKYQVLRPIKSGGMADVFLARNVDHGALFAVKVLADHLAQIPSVVARFREEAKTEARLSGHPNIIPVFDIGEGNGLYYIVMPYVQGEDLANLLLRDGRLHPADAANIIAQVAEALSWAEAEGVVHRDLKPSNVRLDTSGRAIVLDFGIAKASRAAGDLTLPGQGLGTPLYMSPEQFLEKDCDARSDLYSLGVVFFELLTGKHPFPGDSYESIRKVHLATIRPSIRAYDPELPASYESVVLRLLQLDPEDRFQNAKDLLAALSRLGVKPTRSELRPQANGDKVIEPRPPTPNITNGPSGTSWAPLDPFTNSAVSDPERSGISHSGREAYPVLDPIPELVPVVIPRPKRRRQTILAIALILLTLITAVLAISLLLRPKSVITGAHGTMLFVPAGDFIFGDDSPLSPRPRQKVFLRAFYVDQTEVSNQEYKKFCDETRHAAPASVTNMSQPLFPVADITFDDAQAYAAWAGKRLPTEQEWEKSARGTDGRPYPWGWDRWTEGVPHDLQPVDSFTARQSPLGARNMAGNVWEWTQSPYPVEEAEYAALKKSSGVDISRQWFPIKGGSYSAKYDPRWFLSYTRLAAPRDWHSPSIGFRCVRDVPAGVSGPTLFDRVRSLFAR